MGRYGWSSRLDLSFTQPPSGIGKSVGTLFPPTKGRARATWTAFFFLTAKTSGRQQALDAMASSVRPEDKIAKNSKLNMD